MNALSSTATATDTTSRGANTNVSDAKPRTAERMTRSGARTSAICSGELMTTANAYSDRFLAASWTPTTFSMALPAIATTTSPANVSEIPIELIAGCRASTNQSDTNAAATALRASITTANATCQRGFSASSGPPGRPGSSPRRSDAGSVRTNSSSRNTDAMTDSAVSCDSAGAWMRCATDGITIAATDTRSMTVM